MEERLTGAGLVGDGGEQSMHSRACCRRAHTGEKPERTVGSARLEHRREQQDDPLRSTPVVDERDATELAAVLLEEDTQTSAAEADELGRLIMKLRETWGALDQGTVLLRAARVAQRVLELEVEEPSMMRATEAVDQVYEVPDDDAA